MLLRDEPYEDLGSDWLAKRNDEAHTRRLVAQFERLGHKVLIGPAAWIAPAQSLSGSARRR
jgi:transposase